jgi:hypothetical protein
LALSVIGAVTMQPPRLCHLDGRRCSDRLRRRAGRFAELQRQTVVRHFLDRVPAETGVS